MADRKISDLTALTTPASGDYLPIVDISEAAAASKNKRVTIESLFQGIPVNVGLGTSSPSYLLDVVSTGESNVRIKSGSTASAYLRLGTASKDFAIYADQTSSSLNFYDITAATERLRITSAGLVGLGTSSPVYLVDAQGGRALFTDNSSTFSVGVRNRASLAPNGNFWIGATNAVSPDMVFSNNAGNERMRLTDGGLVGIGTTSPGSLLHLADAGHITVGTTTGTKIGTGTTQKIGFYNATPVVQPTAVADATDAASVITQLNALLTRMRNLGLIAT
jgi:hypothetical protein